MLVPYNCYLETKEKENRRNPCLLQHFLYFPGVLQFSLYTDGFLFASALVFSC